MSRIIHERLPALGTLLIMTGVGLLVLPLFLLAILGHECYRVARRHEGVTAACGHFYWRPIGTTPPCPYCDAFVTMRPEYATWRPEP